MENDKVMWAKHTPATRRQNRNQMLAGLCGVMAYMVIMAILTFRGWGHL